MDLLCVVSGNRRARTTSGGCSEHCNSNEGRKTPAGVFLPVFRFTSIGWLTNANRGEGMDKAGMHNVLFLPPAGGPLGQIEITRLGVTAMIFEGTEERTLRRSVGHIPGTALPGQKGNVGIAGHRDTFFRALRNIRGGDELTLATINGSHRYRVDWTQVVDPADTQVLHSTGDDILTLVTCYPFNFAGPAPRKFIVRAQMIPE
jgi:LPXTG-site transpeptidase (sortase) family protein